MEDKVVFNKASYQAIAQMFEQSLLGMLYSGKIRKQMVQQMHDNFGEEWVVEGDKLRLHYTLEVVFNDVLIATQLAKNVKPGRFHMGIVRAKKE